MYSQRLPWFLLLGVCCCCCLLASATPARAATSGGSGGGKIDVNFFYDTLKDEGSWFNTTEYGDVWQPYIAYKSDSWRPYTDGYWTYTDGGWMFVSNESFGWAVYHYGRWTKLQDIGWAWVPGTEWAPAWVTWRESKPDAASGTPATDAPVSATTTNAPDSKDNPPPAPAASDAPAPGGPGGPDGNYIGWAPLPPAPIGYGTGYAYGPGVDVEFGIDPYAYVFTDYRSFGDPWLAGVIFGPDRGYYCCDHSVNITNVYYNNRGGYRGFYNGGPDFNRLRGATARPIQQLAVQRSTNSALVRQQIRSGQFNHVDGNRIDVAAPRFSQSSVRNGRVTFARRGALPVTPVAKQFAPASAASNPAYQRARESFARQGDAGRAQTPGAPAIATTPRAQQDESRAREDAEHAGRPGGNTPPGAARAEGRPGGEQERRHEAGREVAQERADNRNARHTSSRRAGGGRAERVTHQRSAAPRVERSAPRVTRGGGGGERHGGGEPRGGGAGKKKK